MRSDSAGSRWAILASLQAEADVQRLWWIGRSGRECTFRVVAWYTSFLIRIFSCFLSGTHDMKRVSLGNAERAARSVERGGADWNVSLGVGMALNVRLGVDISLNVSPGVGAAPNVSGTTEIQVRIACQAKKGNV